MGAAWTCAELAWLLGSTVTVAAVAFAAAPFRLITPQVVAGPAALMAYAGALGSARSTELVDVAGVRGAGGHGLGRSADRPGGLAATVGICAAFPWLHLTLDALASALTNPTLRDVWAGPGPMLGIAAVLLLLVPVGLGAREPTLITLLGGAAATLVTIAVGVPAVDEGPTTLAAASLAALLAWTLVAWRLGSREPWRGLALIPATAAAVPVVATVLTLSMQAVMAVVSTGPAFSRAADAPLGPVDPIAEPWLLLVGVAALVAAAWVARPAGRVRLVDGSRRVDRTGWRRNAGSAVRAAVACRWPPVVAVAAVLVGSGARAIGCGLLARRDRGGPAQRAAHRTRRRGDGCSRCLVPADQHSRSPACSAGWWPHRPWPWRSGRSPTWPASRRRCADTRCCWQSAYWHSCCLAPRSRLSGWITALVAVPAAINADVDPMTATAMHLTLAGVLVAGSALVNPRRQELGWLGGLLLAAATWVRLADLGVEAPEAYTLPSALALIAVGLVRLARDPGASTATALTPGLLLATVPSLIWCLDDPVSWRAVWLGAACLGAGPHRHRWHGGTRR